MSMDAYHKALYNFWRNIAVDGETFPVWLIDAVPEDVAFPYITFDVSKAAAFGETPLSATIWYKKEGGDSKNAARAAFLDAAAKAIPEEGVKIAWNGGFCILHRSSGDFLSLMRDENDKTIIGGRVAYEVTIYDM